MRKVVVSPYDEQWVLLFTKEADELKMILGEERVSIHHFGSTSIPGLEAKPIIDILAVAKDITLVDGYNPALKAFGYEGKGENGIPGRRYFQKGGNDRTHHLHIYQIDSPEIERHLAFRDYLRTHSDVMKEYGGLKRRLSRQFPYDIESYIRGKEELALKIQEEALAWYRKSRK
ncbi:GrpB family protein [Planococcus shenhongbingii]|uniref:GrpB family protein n=1 Tax=Planococcus shenhongbingii TaxID=3058398 RepID=A0ABT8NCS6_9BACL|nr:MULTISPECIES: GrpB family protein [unclassified Planococcus (in: firmicutes)]MDN7245646.1 GrpB family protein [Planococcus sp. N017]WKA60243.1 GrpB family protein [Planococcus sp. N016]